MNRREALGRVTAIFGAAVIGADAFLAGCEKRSSLLDNKFSDDVIALLDEVGDTIIPQTDSPGAKACAIGAFMKTIVTDCYDEQEQGIFWKGLNELEEKSNKEFGKSFVAMSSRDKHALLEKLDKESKTHAKEDGKESKHYFTMIKQLTVWGYFTSEVGATQALRYLPVPGFFNGCMPYTKGDKAWAL
jgi:hypothetical protein